MRPAAAEEFPQPVTTEHYAETLQNPEPIVGETLCLDPEPYCNSCYGCEAPEPPPYFLRFRGGASYFDSQDEDRIGGAYSLDLAVPISNAVAGFVSVSANHLPGASQYLATIGVLKGGTGKVRGRFGFHTTPPAQSQLGENLARLSYTVLFDQFTDSRISGMYVTQIRSSISYAFYENAALGIQYSKPIQGDVVNFRLAPNVQFNLPLDFSEAISVYGSGWYGNTQLSGSVSYRDGINAVGYSGNIRRPVSDRVTAFVNANYIEEGLWATFVGFEIALGPSRNSGWECSGHNLGSDVVVRAQIPQGLCGAPGIKYRNRRAQESPFDDPAMSEPLNGMDAQTAANSIMGMGAVFRMVELMDMAQNGNFNGNGIDFTADCDTLIPQVIAASNGNLLAAQTLLINADRFDCLSDPRLVPLN